MWVLYRGENVTANSGRGNKAVHGIEVTEDRVYVIMVDKFQLHKISEFRNPLIKHSPLKEFTVPSN